MNDSASKKPYDVALSFAGEDRPYVEQVAAQLRERGVSVFYDEYEKARLWGKDLYVHLNEVYGNQAEYTIMFVSEHYSRKQWANHERRAAQERAFRENREYILPARFDDTPIPGVPTTVAYIDLRRTTPRELTHLIAEKLVSLQPDPDRWSSPGQVFIMHAATRGAMNLEYTVANRRRFREITSALPEESEEREYLATDDVLHRSFPTPLFNCWGVPSAARPSFNRTRVGDLVLFMGTIREGAAIEHIGVVRTKCPFPCHDSSRILWPEVEMGKAYPLLFFFDTEVGHRSWDDFCRDIGSPGYDPRGWYKRIGSERFAAFGGPAGYLRYLRTECGFTSLPADRVVTGESLLRTNV
jgi:hypothetical protein